mgnify:CR=1 FL=1
MNEVLRTRTGRNKMNLTGFGVNKNMVDKISYDVDSIMLGVLGYLASGTDLYLIINPRNKKASFMRDASLGMIQFEWGRLTNNPRIITAGQKRAQDVMTNNIIGYYALLGEIDKYAEKTPELERYFQLKYERENGEKKIFEEFLGGE